MPVEAKAGAANYGLDAPGVVRNLAIGGALALLASLAIPRPEEFSVVHPACSRGPPHSSMGRASRPTTVQPWRSTLCIYSMRYEWDEAKNLRNQRKHGGISFELGALVFEDERCLVYADRIDGRTKEQR